MEVTASECGVSFLGDKNVLKLDSSDSCKPFEIIKKITELCIYFKRANFYDI